MWSINYSLLDWELEEEVTVHQLEVDLVSLEEETVHQPEADFIRLRIGRRSDCASTTEFDLASLEEETVHQPEVDFVRFRRSGYV